MRLRIFILLVISVLLLSFSQPLWAGSENTIMSPKIGPLLRKKLQSDQPPDKSRSAGRTALIKVIVVMNRDHLSPLPEVLLEELRVRVEGLGGHIGNHAYNNVQVWLPIDGIDALAKWSEIEFIREPIRPQLNGIVSEGADVIKATSWDNNGLTGSGVKIGIIDIGFQGYSSLLGNELPTSTKIKVLGSSADFTKNTHGAACAEIVHDIARDAELFLVNVSDIRVDFHNAVTWLQSQGVKVISSSIAINSKIYCEFIYDLMRTYTDPNYIANQMAALESTKEQWDATVNSVTHAGITWSQAAGNDGRKKWVGWFNDSDGDSYLNFSPNENYNKIELPPFSFFLPPVYVVMLWGEKNAFTTYDDYDLYITDSFGSIVDSSTYSQSLLPIGVEACKFIPVSGVKYYAWVSQWWATPQKIGLLIGTNKFPNFTHFNAEKTVVLSTPGPNPNVITVGAVPYDNPSNIEPFSSHGPNGEGIIKPDLVAPDKVSTASFGVEAFLGTSAAAPHVAGVCALVKEAKPEWSPGQIKGFLESNALDLGPPGKDNTYGSGLVRLPDVSTILSQAPPMPWLILLLED